MMEYFITCLCMFINLFANVYIYKLITKESIWITKRNSILFFVGCALLALLRYLNMAEINLITNIVFIVFMLIITYKIKLKKAVYYLVIIVIISLLSDAIVSMFLSNSLLKNYNNFKENIYFRSALVIPVTIVELLIPYIPFLKKIINRIYNGFIEKIKFKKITILFFFTIFTVLLTFFCLNAYSTIGKSGHLFLIICIVSFLVLFVLLLQSMCAEFQYAQLNKKIIDENTYIKQIAQQDAEFKHNVINNLLGIKTVSSKKVGLLIDEMINSYQTDYKTISNINDLPGGIQSIIYKKAYDENIDNLNLIVDNDIKNELYDILSPKQYNNLCTSIGILFDNALDAVKEIDEKIIFIEFEEDDKNIYISMKNSFLNIVDVDEIGNKNYTTKKTGHGIGLNYIYKLKTLKYEREIINNMFASKLTIKKTKKV